ncbi:hypothetical protein [Paenibacillus mucilaginosus]|uniref:Uncharacterized protein n=1 Tax=Paenibacillus mucilaginosus (strain KNP414) TaxID=1036673 RepID=F8FLW5_PAEMK|nr:hypothetical protein [Paenibacillus mucilaginosus]AEI44881.1 hypothetical protein KNP414_06360 [Paenibacillus mucilaginosus KNP414]MCG7214924.1 hypothetical protein [Paenibacillus mucilaginosus]WDM26400.1 hypothetical protein KCX80_28850 [Paenibacillus mucilaginosus]
MKRTRSSLHRDLPRSASLSALVLLAAGTLDLAQTLLLPGVLTGTPSGGAAFGWDWAAVLLLHLLLCAGVWLLFRTTPRYRPHDRASLQWITTLGLFLPGAGLLCGAFIVIALWAWRYDDEFFREYENYVYYVPGSLDTFDVNVEQQAALIPFREILLSGGYGTKKDAMFSLLQYEGGNKVALFQEALRDEDPEVVHYAATTLTYLNELFVREIKKETRELQADENSLHQWKALLQTYVRYLDSRLLTEELAAEVRTTLHRFVQRGASLFPSEPFFTEKLCYLARAEGDFALAERLARTLETTAEYRYVSYLASCERLYQERRFEELRRLSAVWWNSGVTIPESYQSAVRLWKEMNDQGVPQTSDFELRYR